jgi:hypothetical protein
MTLLYAQHGPPHTPYLFLYTILPLNEQPSADIRSYRMTPGPQSLTYILLLSLQYVSTLEAIDAGALQFKDRNVGLT